MRYAAGSLLVAVLLVLGRGADTQKDEQATSRLRRPIALALVDGGKRLLVANQGSGTIAIIDTEGQRSASETRVGRRLSSLSLSAIGDLLAVTDEEAGELVLHSRRGGELREVQRLQVGLTPVSVQISDDAKLATVACLWPRRLVIVEIAAGGKSKAAIANIDLSFAPRRQLLVPGTAKVIVADAFGGKLAVVDIRQKKIESERDLALAVHNIRGLALDQSGKHVWLTHQTINATGRTTQGDIRTGNLITNNVRKLSLAAVLDPRADILRDEQVYVLGDVDRGAGDPAEVADGADGQLLVALAGVQELAIGRPDKVIWTRVPVGRRPTALAVDQASRRAYVANTFADSISVVDLRIAKVVREIRLGSEAKLGPEERGEMLFFDARLSFEGWFSCHSCHSDGHTSGRLNDNLSDGSFGTPKRVLSLLGVRDTGPWAWNGKMPDLETQIRSSLKSTMQGRTPKEIDVNDLTAFLKTLPAPPSLLKARGVADADAVQRGRKVFAREKCATCHAPPAYTSAKTYDVGIHDELGGKLFNPPSLRGVSQGGPYFHDNRARTLDEVFTRYRHQLAEKLTPEEMSDLLHFLNSL
jgi:cytochrome c peroxidase